jgi:hypothetical protein
MDGGDTGGFDDAAWRAWRSQWFTTGLHAVEHRLASEAGTGTFAAAIFRTGGSARQRADGFKAVAAEPPMRRPAYWDHATTIA